MSISDLIVVMRDGVVQQVGAPQEVYDSPANLFVAKFLGTPPINVFDAEIRDGKIYIGGEAVLDAAGLPDMPVTAAVRPEGFVLKRDGALTLSLSRVEVMGRDVSVVSSHERSQNDTVRSIIGSENIPAISGTTVRFDLKPSKVFIFECESGKRIDF